MQLRGPVNGHCFPLICETVRTSQAPGAQPPSLRSSTVKRPPVPFRSREDDHRLLHSQSSADLARLARRRGRSVWHSVFVSHGSADRRIVLHALTVTSVAAAVIIHAACLRRWSARDRGRQDRCESVGRAGCCRRPHCGRWSPGRLLPVQRRRARKGGLRVWDAGHAVAVAAFGCRRGARRVRVVGDRSARLRYDDSPTRPACRGCRHRRDGCC